MRNRNKNIRTGFSRFLRYFKGGMTGEERNSFERDLQRDPFAKEASEGFASVDPDRAVEDLKYLREMIKRRTGSKRTFTLYRIAASLAVLMILSSVFVVLQRKKMSVTSLPEKSYTPVTKKPEPAEKEEVADYMAAESRKKTDSQIKTQVGQMIAEDRTSAESFKKAETSRELVKQSKRAEADTIVYDIQQSESIIADNSNEKGDDELDKATVASGNAGATEENTDSGYLSQDTRTIPSTATDRALKSERRTTTGRVISADDRQPVAGASVTVKGTSLGSITDMDGNFSINVPDSQTITLVANFIGMKSEESTVNSGSPIEFNMEPEVNALDEVVVVGYGVQEKSNVQSEGYKPAEPSTGQIEFDRYIRDNIQRPDSSTEGQRVVVVAGFRVRTDGSINDIRILRSPDQGFSDEAIRLIKSGPLWNPAEQDGVPVEDNVRLRIVFR